MARARRRNLGSQRYVYKAPAAAAPGPAVPAPAAAATPAPPPATPDSGYYGSLAWSEAQRGDVRTRFGDPSNTTGSFAQRYGSEGETAARRYGVEAGYDNDPFNMAKELERSYQQGREGTTNRIAAQGGLYSGAMDTELGNVDRRYAQQGSELRQGYQGELARIQGGATEALAALDRGDIEAFNEWLSRAQAQAPPQMAEAGPASFLSTDPEGTFRQGPQVVSDEDDRKKRRRKR